MKVIRQSAFLVCIISLVAFVACKRTIGGIDRDTPPLPSGNQFIELSLSTLDGTTLPSYTIDVTAPDGSTSSSSGSTDSFVIDPIQTGTYSVTVSSSTHVGQSKEITVNLPAETSDDYVVGADFVLTTKNTSIIVDNVNGGDYPIPSMNTGAGGIGASSMTISFPAGAISGTGTTAISITPTPSEGGSTSNGIKGVKFDFDPDMTFNSPVTISMPLDYPQALVNSGTQVIFEHEETGETELFTLSGNGSTGTVEISHFSQWTIILGLRYTITNSTRSQTFISDCSEGLDQPFTFSGTYGPIVSNLLQLPSNLRTVTINGTVEKEPILYYFLTGRATAFTISYELATLNGTVLEQRNNIPLCKSCYTVNYTSTECHDSGG